MEPLRARVFRDGFIPPPPKLFVPILGGGGGRWNRSRPARWDPPPTDGRTGPLRRGFRSRSGDRVRVCSPSDLFVCKACRSRSVKTLECSQNKKPARGLNFAGWSSRPPPPERVGANLEVGHNCLDCLHKDQRGSCHLRSLDHLVSIAL